MQFEYDPDKSKANKIKHNIDFEKAKRLWFDEGAIQIKVPFDGEERYLIIRMLHNRHWTAVVTYRNESVRIISVRRSGKQEVEHYERQNKC
jgi:uncharacterized DUF497 family protein